MGQAHVAQVAGVFYMDQAHVVEVTCVIYMGQVTSKFYMGQTLYFTLWGLIPFFQGYRLYYYFTVKIVSYV